MNSFRAPNTLKQMKQSKASGASQCWRGVANSLIPVSALKVASIARWTSWSGSSVRLNLHTDKEGS